jgi:hypothetical protein
MGRALNATAPPLARVDVDAPMRDLVGSMLDTDPARRPSLDEVAGVLRGEAAESRPPGRRGRWLTAVAAVVVVIGGVALFRVVSDEGKAASDTSATTETTVADSVGPDGDPTGPWIPETDESAAVAAAAEPVRGATRDLVGADRSDLQVPVGLYFSPSLEYPEITSFPNMSFWRFANEQTAEPGCREYFPPAITMTGFSADLAKSAEVATLVSSMAFSNENGAAQMLRGRTIGMGVRGEDCMVNGANVEIEQRDAPPATVPEWADELASWKLDESMLAPGDRAGYAYFIRVGRRVWELRVTEVGDREVTEAELSALIEAIGRSAAIPLQAGAAASSSTTTSPTTTSPPSMTEA